MHTPEQAKGLWCPMARVAQSGHTDIHTSYNRALTKEHKPMRSVRADPDTFQLGEEPEETTVLVLTTTTNVSMAAHCIGDRCAMWRWAQAEETRVKMRSTPDPMKPGQTIEYPVLEPLKSNYGYCGLAGRPVIF